MAKAYAQMSIFDLVERQPAIQTDGVSVILADFNQKKRAGIMKKHGFSRDQMKLMDAGFSIVKYIREEKKILQNCSTPELGWFLVGVYPTYAAAERKLKEMKDGGCIETDLDGTIIMSGWNQPGGLLKAGFEFYRCYGLREYDANCCIKQGSKNWSNWGKYKDQAELREAWDKLMNEDMKALEG